MFGLFDPLYFLFLAPGLLIAVWATWRVKSNFRKYSNVPIRSGHSGADVARLILRQKGVHDVEVEPASGFLSDHYDSRAKKLRLSPDVYNGRSVAAAGIAAHEAGHALQHAARYSPLILRQTIAPVAAVGSNLSWVFILIGGIVASAGLMKLGLVLFTVFVLFSLITLPVEFDASRRAKDLLPELGVIARGGESVGVQKVLGAAAMTYVAAAVSAIMTLLYYLVRLGMLGGRDE